MITLLYADITCQSPDWTYLQTPQFSLASPSKVLSDIELELSVRNGVISSGQFEARGSATTGAAKMDLPAVLNGRKLHEILSWDTELSGVLPDVSIEKRTRLCEWLQTMLPPPIE